MIKKILFSICVLFSFFLMFFFGLDKINVLAYSDIGNALGSYPVKLDVDNYNRENLLDMPLASNLTNVDGYLNANVYEHNLVSIEGSTGPVACNGPVLFSNLNLILQPGTYTLHFLNVNYGNSTKGPIVFMGSGVWSETFRIDMRNKPANTYATVTLTDTYTVNAMRLWSDQNVTYDTTFQVMFYKGSVNTNITYGDVFKFGYNVNYSLSVNNLTSNQINAGIAITDINGNYLKTGNCVIPANSSTICSNINDPLYLPFNIDNNGFVSFDYSLGLFIGPVGLLSVTPSDSGLNFVPVFDAYYQGSPTNNLYFKDRYTFNNLFLSGFNVSVNSSTLSKVTFPRNKIDSEFSMNSNKIVNFATDKKIQTGIYNYINYVAFIDSSPSDIYSFVVTTGVSSPGLFENRIYTISFSNLSLKVNGDSSNSSPLPNNPNTINKYNECSVWYDIPCQLGNGLTYVIYEAPIISPVLTFIVSFITMFSSLVSFVDLFRTFGVVFGCFIIYMFINLLHKYSK